MFFFYSLWALYSRYAIFDTPGQIEVFTWSASGAIITEALASSFATIVVYIIDTARSTSPVTFMSNMLYACSILYKTKLPFIVVLNKVSIIIVSLCNSVKNLHREESHLTSKQSKILQMLPQPGPLRMSFQPSRFLSFPLWQ